MTHATASCIVGVLKCAPWRGKRPRAQRRISHVKRCSARQLQPVAGERWLLAADRRCAYRLGGGFAAADGVAQELAGSARD